MKSWHPVQDGNIARYVLRVVCWKTGKQIDELQANLTQN